MTHPATTGNIAELVYRERNGIAVSHLWQRLSNRLSVVVEHRTLGEHFTLTAAPENARDVFEHPYVYARRAAFWARRGAKGEPA